MRYIATSEGGRHEAAYRTRIYGFAFRTLRNLGIKLDRLSNSTGNILERVRHLFPPQMCGGKKGFLFVPSALLLWNVTIL